MTKVDDMGIAMRFSAALMLALLAFAPVQVRAADRVEVFTASTKGTLVIDGEGRVAEVDLDRKELGDELMDAFEQRIREWRFEPIVEDGRPVRAKGHMSLRLVALREKGVDGIRLAFEEVGFVDAGSLKGPGSRYRSRPPRYPPAQAMRGVGAHVTLMLRVDENGDVAEAAAESVLLLGHTDSRQAQRASAFVKEAEAAAAEWHLPGYAGGFVKVPIYFFPPGARGDRWIRSWSVEVDVPQWVEAQKRKGQVLALNADGGAQSERWKLLSSLEG